METKTLEVIDIAQYAATDLYKNVPLALVNNHVVRMSVMTESYFWHRHPNSDETFLVIEGSIFIDLEGRTVELFPNQLYTIPQNIIHRTRPNGNRSVNLTFESTDMETVRLEENDVIC